MKNFASRLLLLFFLLVPVAANAQSTGTVVADCTTGVGLAYSPGSTRPMTLLPTGAACVSASVSASISGFTAASTGTPISVTTGGDTGTLPAGTVVVATNVGSNAAYCALGASATTASQYIAPSGGWFAFTVGASTQLTCITASSTTTVNMTGGAGLPTGTGGGGGSGGGGAVTIADGADASEGATTDAACAGDNTSGCTMQSRIQRVAQNITTLITAAQSGVGTPGSASPATDIAIGGEGRSAEQTAVTNGQNVKAAFDLIGRQLTVPFAPKALWVQGSASSTDGSAHTIIAAASGSNKNYITDWECSNTSATTIRVTFSDSASTTVIVPAGGGNNKSLRIPLATAAATAFTFTSSSAVSTVYCSAQGFTGL